MSTQQNEYKNDNLHVTVSREPGSKVKLQISISPIATQAAFKEAIKNINKEISMPGFRKGKAPDSYVVKNYKQHVDQEWNDILVNTAFKEALDLVKIYPFGKNSVQRPQIKEVSQENGAKVIIEYEAEPNVPEVNLEELTVKKVEKLPVTPKQIEDVITQIKLSHAQWEDLANQPIAEGDYVDLDIDNLDEGFEICRGTRFAVEKGKIGTWLYDLLIGKNMNDVVEGVSELDHHHHGEACDDPTHDHSHDHDFKSTRCKITIKGHQRASLPDLDDALASKAGAPNVEELNKRIVQSLEKREEERVKMAQRIDIEEQLAEKYHFDLPESLTREDKKSRISHALSHLNREAMSKEEYDSKVKEITEKVSNDLDKAYRLFFIESKIAKENQIDISQEEIMQEFMNQMVSQDTSIINQSMQPEEIRSRLYSYLITQKAKDYILQKAKLID